MYFIYKYMKFTKAQTLLKYTITCARFSFDVLFNIFHKYILNVILDRCLFIKKQEN